MEVKVQKWCNFDEIRTSDSILKSLNDKTITSVSKRKKISLRDRFKEYNDKNLSKAFSWKDSIGREIW